MTCLKLMMVGAAVGKPAVENIMEGKNSSLFGYGQTGSGKTYTILGAMEDSTPEDEVMGCFPPGLSWAG